jgi:flavin reductase (DIM6/NTAB) family NADH-FMN oxidoreductase RutF
MEPDKPKTLVTLDAATPIWDRFFTVFPLVVVGTRDEDGTYDLAPKHLAIPVGWDNFFGFVCTPRHRTYHNARREGAFTVSFPRPSQVVVASLTASPRCEDASKPTLKALPTFKASTVDGVFLEDGYVFLECALDRVIDGFGAGSLIIGTIVAAHVDEAALRLADEDDADLIQQAPLLAYLSPGRFANIKESYAFPFPADFKR